MGLQSSSRRATLVPEAGSKSGWNRATEAGADGRSVIFTSKYVHTCTLKVVEPLVMELQHMSR